MSVFEGVIFSGWLSSIAERCQKIAGGRSVAETTGRRRRSSSGGIAALNHRLHSGNPSGCNHRWSLAYKNWDAPLAQCIRTLPLTVRRGNCVIQRIAETIVPCERNCAVRRTWHRFV